MIRSLCFLAVLATLAAGAQAQTVVSTESELRSAIAGAQPGDVIALANGRWTDVDIVFRATGTERDSIRLVAQTPGEVVLDGTSSLRIAGDYLVVDGLRFEEGVPTGSHLVQFRDGSRNARHSRLTNVTIINANPQFRALDTKWVSLYGVRNRVDHSYIAGKENVGTTVVVWLEGGSGNEPPRHRIDHNHFGPRPELGRNGGETIRIGTSDVSMQDAFVTVERNLFERCDGEAEIISVKSGKNLIRWNTFLRSRGSLTLRHGNGSRVEGNVFLGQRVSDTGGVRIVGEDHVVVNNYFELLAGTGFQSAITIMNGVPNSPLNRYFQVRNVTVAHNTVLRSAVSLTIGAGADAERTLPPENVRFLNNVLLVQGNTVVRQEADPIRMTWGGTVYWGGSLGIDEPAGITRVNPLIDPDDGDLSRPLAGSPVIDAAVAVPGLDLAIDVDGQPRDASPDIGADEVSGAPITLRPLTPDDVGPGWRFATASGDGPDAPAGLRLGLPYPSPSAGAVTVPLVTAEAGRVGVVVVDALGRQVAVLADGPQPAGTRALRWDAAGLAPGLYLVVARTERETATARIVIVPGR